MASKDELIRRIAQLGAHRQELRKAREQVVDRAREQHASMPRTIGIVEDHVEAGTGGGILAHRRLRTLHKERSRLDRVIASHEARTGEQHHADDDDG